MRRSGRWRLGLMSTMVLASLAAAQPPGVIAPIALRDCRLEHPLKLTSLAARCGELTVPEDRDHPASAQLALHVAVVPALNRRANAPPLFVLAGGPGQSATDLYTLYAGAFARIARNHDIVLLDQRGTGSSAPLRCAYPDDWSESANSPAALRAVTQQCLKDLGVRVRFYTTAFAVLDLEEVRGALGYRRIDLYGASYGTRVAQSYMRKFPAQVHAAILDGVVDPQTPIGPDTPRDGEHALELIVARCEHDAECARAYPALSTELKGLRARFGAERLALTMTDPTAGTPLALDFNRSIFGASLRFLSYSAAEASLLPALIHQAAAGMLAPLAAQAIVVSRSLGNQLASGMQNSVVCSEDVPFYTVSAGQRSEMQNTYQGTDQIDGLREICAVWPAGPVDAELHHALRSDVPTLLLSGEADPVTPPSGAEHSARFLTHHRHLILAGEGHGQLATGCVPRLMAQFLDGADTAGLDTSCLAQHRLQPFFLSLTGPKP